MGWSNGIGGGLKQRGSGNGVNVRHELENSMKAIAQLNHKRRTSIISSHLPLVVPTSHERGTRTAASCNRRMAKRDSVEREHAYLLGTA